MPQVCGKIIAKKFCQICNVGVESIEIAKKVFPKFDNVFHVYLKKICNFFFQDGFLR